MPDGTLLGTVDSHPQESQRGAYHLPLHVQNIYITLVFTFSNILSLLVAKACLEHFSTLKCWDCGGHVTLPGSSFVCLYNIPPSSVALNARCV